MSLKTEVIAWRKAFPDHLYSKTADVVMPRARPVVYACHAEGIVRPDCALDTCPSDCVDAEILHAEGKGKESCPDWRPAADQQKGAQP